MLLLTHIYTEIIILRFTGSLSSLPECHTNITTHLPVNDGKFTVALLQDLNNPRTMYINILFVQKDFIKIFFKWETCTAKLSG